MQKYVSGRIGTWKVIRSSLFSLTEHLERIIRKIVVAGTEICLQFLERTLCEKNTKWNWIASIFTITLVSNLGSTFMFSLRVNSDKFSSFSLHVLPFGKSVVLIICLTFATNIICFFIWTAIFWSQVWSSRKNKKRYSGLKKVSKIRKNLITTNATW